MPSLSCLCTRLCAPHNEFDSSPVLLLPIGASETSRTLWTTRNTYAGTLNRTKRKVYSFLRSVDLISICMFRLLVLCSSIAVVYFSPIKFYCNFLFDWSVFCVFKCFRISIVFFFQCLKRVKISILYLILFAVYVLPLTKSLRDRVKTTTKIKIGLSI